MAEITLCNVTRENWMEVCLLNSGNDWTYVAPNSFSLVQEYYTEGLTSKAILADGKIVGYTLYGWHEKDGGYELWRFMIDKSCQGKGYGKKALIAIIDAMFEQYNCSEILLHLTEGNDRGAHIYEKIGFVATDKKETEDVNGEKHVERIYALKRENYTPEK